MIAAIIAATLVGLKAGQTSTTVPSEAPAQHDSRMAWWREARFGMFIHWGLYAIPAGHWNGKSDRGAGEWILTGLKIPPTEYESLRDQFNPVKFDARGWVRTAKQAGMRYIVITSKHHEGFGLWPSKQGDWNIGNTPFKRDVLKELAKACKAEGLRLCFYHSIMDWHHPDYLPRRPWDKRDASHADFERYVAYMKAQLKELLTGYGPIGILWFDGEWESTWTHDRGKDLYAYVRHLQPKIIVNNRVDTGRGGMAGATAKGDFVGDYGTPEQQIPANGIPGQDWESCMTMNDTWGYKVDDNNWKSADTLIKNLIDCASKGGNYLLNVGPTSLGEIPPPSKERLAAIGRWTRRNGEAIYGSTASPFPRPLVWGRVTQKPGKLYLHVFDPSAHEITLTGLDAHIDRVYPLGHPSHLLPLIPGADGPTVSGLPSDDEPVRVFVAEVSGPVAARPMVIKQATDGSLVLKAVDSTITGTDATVEGETGAVGYWTNPADSVAWSFEAAHAGQHKVSIELACDLGSEGSKYEVSIAGQVLSGTVPSTGGWRQFKVSELGSVILPASGTVTVKVTVKSKPGVAVMNLRDIRIASS